MTCTSLEEEARYEAHEHLIRSRAEPSSAFIFPRVPEDCRPSPFPALCLALPSVGPKRHTEAMVEMNPTQAREYWKALMDNASTLITDAHTLLSSNSYGRAGSLTVLAQEELGKALWIYDVFQDDWNQGSQTPRIVEALARHGRSHHKKYLQAFVFGNELAAFWGDYGAAQDRGGDREFREAAHEERVQEAAARAANRAKQAGFYVDYDGHGSVFSPAAIPAGTTEGDLQTAAQVIEMLLIRDHTRMKFYARTPYDSTHTQQFRLLPVSHPQEWRAAVEAVDAEPKSGKRQADSSENPPVDNNGRSARQGGHA